MWTALAMPSGFSEAWESVEGGHKTLAVQETSPGGGAFPAKSNS